RAQLELRLGNPAHQLDAGGDCLDERAARVEQLEQRASAQSVGGLGHFEKRALLAVHLAIEALERLAPQAQRLGLATVLGAQRRAGRSLALACGLRLRLRLVRERAAVARKRDLALDADEVGGAERAARPRAPELHARDRQELA